MFNLDEIGSWKITMKLNMVNKPIGLHFGSKFKHNLSAFESGAEKHYRNKFIHLSQKIIELRQWTEHETFDESFIQRMTALNK